MEWLQNIDTSLFYFINKTLATPFTDKFMPFITESKNWYIFYVISLGYLFFKGGSKGKKVVIMLLVMILITDQGSNFLKEFIGRIRPCKILPDVNLLVGCASQFSFPSNHAMNNFAAAVLINNYYPASRWWIFAAAFIVAISRVFCGVHYPGDIIGGAIIGAAAALAIIYLTERIVRLKAK